MWGEREAEEAGRIFTRHIKQECWKKAGLVPGRDPERWRLDAAGNIVSALLRGCLGCQCHEYDHIFPYSKGGPTALENCQILQTRVNRFKGNDEDCPDKQKQYSCSKQWSDEELDIIELALYGDIKREGLLCRCKSLADFENALDCKLPKKLASIPDCPY
jgi:hypothetical protein